jgi:hypothetical protein
MSQTYGGDFYLSFNAPNPEIAQLIANEIVRKYNADGEAHVQGVLPIEEALDESYIAEEETRY